MNQARAAVMAKTNTGRLRFIEEVTTDVDALQERVLAEILSRNANTEYRDEVHTLAGTTDHATFRA